MQDRKWLLFTCWFSMRIFEDPKTWRFFSLNKTTRLSRQSFESWACSVFKFTCVNTEALSVRQKMVFIDLSTFIANI